MSGSQKVGAWPRAEGWARRRRTLFGPGLSPPSQMEGPRITAGTIAGHGRDDQPTVRLPDGVGTAKDRADLVRLPFAPGLRLLGQ